MAKAQNPFAVRYSLFASLTVAFVALSATAHAQDWPQRPVKLLVPFAAGGNIDVMGRLAAQRLSETLGQQFIVENRVGGNGTIATEAVARAPADGYTLLWASTSVIAIFPAITKVPYDPAKDFAPIGLFSTSPQVLVVNPKFPAGTVAEFVAHVKAQPNKLAYAGGGGPGSASNLLMALFLKRAGLQMQNVSYRGTAPAMTDLIAGHIPTMFVPISEALPQARAGNIRMLAVSSGTRARQAPDVPTIAEFGLCGFPRGVLDRHGGAGRNPQAGHRSRRGRARARYEGRKLRRAAAQEWRRSGRPRSGAILRLHRQGDHALGRRGQDRRRHAAVGRGTIPSRAADG